MIAASKTSRRKALKMRSERPYPPPSNYRWRLKGIECYKGKFYAKWDVGGGWYAATFLFSRFWLKKIF